MKRAVRSRAARFGGGGGASAAIGALLCALGIAVVAQSSGCVDGATADCSDANTYCGPEAAVDSGVASDAGDAGDARSDAGDGRLDAGDAADASSDATAVDPDASTDASADAADGDAG